MGLDSSIVKQKEYDNPVASPSLGQIRGSRAVNFGLAVHLDLKFEHDFKRDVFVCLSMVDEATTYHAARLLRNQAPEHTARKFINGWVAL